MLLVVALWLLAMRNSRREAARFGEAAQTLAQESALLERRLATVNRELSLARDFIAAQSRDLESLGRVASERISQHADRLQGLIHDNGAQVEAIGRVSTTALENMDRLRDGLPVISNSARDVASQIGHAGAPCHRRDRTVAQPTTRPRPSTAAKWRVAGSSSPSNRALSGGRPARRTRWRKSRIRSTGTGATATAPPDVSLLFA